LGRALPGGQLWGVDWLLLFGLGALLDCKQQQAQGSM
jgi:hypothetical protein